MTKGKTKKASQELQPERNSRPGLLLAFVVLYVIVVLGIDALAALQVSWPFDWTVFQWRPDDCWRLLSLDPPLWTRTSALRSFDLFKFLFWLVVPFCCCLRRMEWSWFSIRTWKRSDWILLAVFLAGGAVAVLSIRYIPSLRRAYPGMSHLPWAVRGTRGLTALVWTASWLVGWEFLHRYVLLRTASARFPRVGWLLVPLSEVLYHLQKPLLEAAGMGLFSLVLTWWSLKRKNVLLPFLIHLYIEVLLIAARILVL